MLEPGTHKHTHQMLARSDCFECVIKSIVGIERKNNNNAGFDTKTSSKHIP